MVVADPIISPGLTKIRNSWYYDSSKFIFQPSLSGPLAPYGVGGSTFSVASSIGTKPVGIIDKATYSPASLLAGSTLTYNLSSGYVEAVLSFDSPGISVPNGEHNFFVFGFESIAGDINPSSLITYNSPSSFPPPSGSGGSCYSNTPVGNIAIGGSGSFTQESFTCEFVPVPGPLPVLGVAAAFSYARRIRRRLDRSSLCSNSDLLTTKLLLNK
jgi:hypothetical protein